MFGFCFKASVSYRWLELLLSLIQHRAATKIEVLAHLFDTHDRTGFHLQHTDKEKNHLENLLSPSLSLYKIVVFPAASRPTIKILISNLPYCFRKKSK